MLMLMDMNRLSIINVVFNFHGYIATHGLIMSILGEIPCLEGCNMNLLVGTGGRTSPGKGVFVWRRGRPVKDCTRQAIQ